MANLSNEFKDSAVTPEVRNLQNRGTIRQPTAKNNLSIAPSNQQFNQALDGAMKKFASVPELIEANQDKIVEAANKVAQFAEISPDIAQRFLERMSSLEAPEELIKIAEAANIPALADNAAALVQNIPELMVIPGLEKVGFLANGLAALEQPIGAAFGALQGAVPRIQGLVGDQIGALVGTAEAALPDLLGMAEQFGEQFASDFGPGLTNVSQGLQQQILANVGGFTGIGNQLTDLTGDALAKLQQAAQLLDAGDIPGQFFMEVQSGIKIPTTVIAKNPMAQGPSYVGKAMFGELNKSIDDMDITKLFPKQMARFPAEELGAGVSSFVMQTFNSFAGSQPMNEMINIVNYGVRTLEDAAPQIKVEAAQLASDVAGKLGVAVDSAIELSRPDNAIPFMGAASSLFTDQKMSIPLDVFQKGFKEASSALNHAQRVSPDFLRTVRALG